MKEGQLLAMESIFDFCEAMTEHELTAMELLEVMRLAVADGQEMMMISLVMATKAAAMLVDERREAAKERP